MAESQEKDEDSYSDFGDISVEKTAHERNELEEYLKLPIEKVMDPLMWWYNNRNVYPCLSRMALDYLSAPRKLLFIAFIILLIISYSYIYCCGTNVLARSTYLAIHSQFPLT